MACYAIVIFLTKFVALHLEFCKVSYPLHIHVWSGSRIEILGLTSKIYISLNTDPMTLYFTWLEIYRCLVSFKIGFIKF